ncbi:Drug/metabolite transporter [Corchorus olitorius]|uniref:Drug/metabolite transporter n=1 Tax=Corchorus olitorius TaxID=93759 RepID=A0A1R3JQ74_9ROSI|nr:Drug/metabolite transporter [Corchorus olitorius]
MTFTIFAKIMVISLIELEKVEIRKVQSQAKVVGTLVTVGGAMVMTFLKGPFLEPPWTMGGILLGHQSKTSEAHQEEDFVKGTFLLIAGCCCWSFFIISQAFILKSYPAKLSLTVLICTMGAVEGTILALIVERDNTSVWHIHLDSKLIAAVNGGFVSAFAIYTMGSVTKKKGPVFVSAFNPLGLVIVAILGFFVLAEEMYLASLWGKSKDQPHSDTDSGSGTVAESDQQMSAIENGEARGPSLFTITSNRVRPIEESD